MEKFRIHIIRVLYGAAVFIAALFISGHFMTNHAAATVEDLSQASLPLVTMMMDGQPLNELHGCVEERNLTRFRAALTPLGTDRSVSLRIELFGTDLTGLSYEVRPLSGSRLIEKTEVEELPEEEDGQINVSITLKDLIGEDTDYVLVIVLSTGDQQNIRYYTRICCDEDVATAAEALAFVEEFHDKTIEGTDTSYLADYIEPEGDSDSLASIDIHSSLEQVAFNGLQPSEVVAPVYTMTDRDGSVFLLNGSYVVELPATGTEETAENGRTRRFLCREYYRITRGFDRFHLLSFRRTMEEIPDLQQAAGESDVLQLGVGDTQMQVVQNQEGSMLAFVSCGSLYCVVPENSTLTRIFSFSGAADTDRRELYPEHRIRILSIGEDDSIDFLVYGYMNRGRQEGRIGVAEYHYQPAQHTMEEMAYLSYDGSAELLISQIENSVYLNDKGELYFLLNDELFRVDTRQHEIQLAESTSGGSEIVSSENGQMTAWTDRETGAVIFTDLSDYSQQKIEPEEGEILTPIGFLNEDLILGSARQSDSATDDAGIVFTPMYRLRIMNHALQVLEDYQREPYYITDAVIDGNQVTLHRVEKTAEGYTDAADDQIVNAAADSSGITPTLVRDDRFGRVRTLGASGFDPSALRYVTAKELTRDKIPDLTEDMNRILPAEEEQGTIPHYYVYSTFGYERSYRNAADAVRRAADEGGVVIADNGNYAWRQVVLSRCQLDGVGDNQDYTEAIREGTLTAAGACLEAMVRYAGGSLDAAAALQQGENASTILESGIEGSRALELSGCSLEEVLYYPAAGTPVLAGTSTGAVLIIGYGPRNIAIWDPASGEAVTLWSRSRAQREFQSAGNRFLAYIDH